MNVIVVISADLCLIFDEFVTIFTLLICLGFWWRDREGFLLRGIMLPDSVVHWGCVVYRIDWSDGGDRRAPRACLLSSVAAHKEFVFKKRGPEELPPFLWFLFASISLHMNREIPVIVIGWSARPAELVSCDNWTLFTQLTWSEVMLDKCLFSCFISEPIGRISIKFGIMYIN